jgi:hypothetical protein
MLSSRWTTIPDDNIIKVTLKAITRRGINVIFVENRAEALAKLTELIPKDAEVMAGSSTTLEEIGFSNYLELHDKLWKSLNQEIRMENDSAKRHEIRRRAVTAEYFLGSINAISMNGELVACDRSGSRVGAYLYAAKKLLLVAGAQKITANLEEAIKRVEEFVYPLENKRAMKAEGTPSAPNKWAIIKGETIPDRITLILVRESLGF